MSDGEGDANAGSRPLPNRIGIVLLNLLGPGLGLLRTERLRPAVLLLLTPHILLGLIILLYAFAPTLNFWGWAGAALGALALLLVAYTIAMAMSWRTSRTQQGHAPWWSRWYAILGAAALGFGVAWLSGDVALSFYKSFYLPSESMTPSFAKGDRFVASMRGPGDLRRGDLVLVESNFRGVIYFSRIAALAGDRIGVLNGVVILNGQPVSARQIGIDTLPRDAARGGPEQATRLAEQFPGEAASHEIHDTGVSQGDDYPVVQVPPGHVFVLGDNRDDAADSRFGPEHMGLGMVPVDRVRGRPLFHSWGSSRPMGTPIGAR